MDGADSGACYLADDRPCAELSTGPGIPAPGFACLERGGILVPDESCAHLNGYYVSPLVEIDGDAPARAVTVRGDRARLETDGAIEWITRRRHRGPWMATVSYSADHSPYQQPPAALLPPGTGSNVALACGSTSPDQKTLSNQMVEALDSELGRLLVAIGLATRLPDGWLDDHPEKTDTMLVIPGDNGSFAPSVKLPFNPSRPRGSRIRRAPGCRCSSPAPWSSPRIARSPRC